MGMIDAAVITSRIINSLHPKNMIMTGICAGVKGKTELGDVILASPAWDWQAGKYSSDGQDDRWFSIAPHHIDIDPVVFRSFINTFNDGSIMSLIQEARDYNSRLQTKAHAGPVATGSSVLADTEAVEKIKQQHRNLIGIEMEVYGFYAACLHGQLPKPRFFAIKSVCDMADSEKGDSVQEYAAYASATAAFNYITRNIDLLAP